MATTANDMRKGMVLTIDNELFYVMECQHITPGNLRAFVQARLRSLKSGSSSQRRFRSTESVEQVFLDTKSMEFLYKEGDSFVFMDDQTFEQVSLTAELVGEFMGYVPHNSKVNVTFNDGQAVSVDLPASIVLEITESEPGAKGNSATNIFKTAKCETGLVVKVPLHIGTGDLIKVDTRTGEFLGRVTSR